MDEMKHLGEILKLVPNLQNLKLILYRKYLRDDIQNFKYLLNGINQLQCLKHLDLNLFCNELGVRKENFENLRDFTKKLPRDLQHLNLCLSSNNLLIPEIFQHLIKGIR